MDDTTPMHFGKYKGTPIADVPVDYLHHVYHNFTGAHVDSVKDYVEKSIGALKMEKPDLIWNIQPRVKK